LWAEIKRDVDGVLRQGSLSIDLFAKIFKSVGITADPRVYFRYAPMHDSLWMNVWGVMYHPPFEIAGTLVHENEHRAFSVEKGVVGASYDELLRFGNIYGREGEIRAHQKELVFLKAVRDLIDRTWIIILPTNQINYDFDKTIVDREQRLEALSSSSATSNAHEYQVASTAKANEDILNIMKMLNVNLQGLDRTLRKQSEPTLWETEF
jgi:hypothetical protein